MAHTARIRLQALPNADTRHSGNAEIVAERFTLGRGEGNDWVLADPKRVISKTHAVIERREGRYRLTDRSTNGTSVNGRPLGRGESHVLRDGDEMAIGGYGFRVIDEGAAAAGPSTGAPAITSILHDLAPSAGVGASIPIAGERADIGEASGPVAGDPIAPLLSPDDAGSGAGRGTGGVALPLGWDSPPGMDAPDLGATGHAGSAARDLTDRSEQAPADRRLVDLPLVPYRVDPISDPEATPSELDKGEIPAETGPVVASARPIIPLDWLEDDGEDIAPRASPGRQAPSETPAPPGSASPPVRPEIDTRSIEMVPVTNIDVDADPSPTLPPTGTLASPPPDPAPLSGSAGTADPAPMAGAPDPAGRATLLAALCKGAGIAPDTLDDADAERLLGNAGMALAILGEELRALQAARLRTATRLDFGRPDATAWINAIGAQGDGDAPEALMRALAECAPGEVEGLRADMRDLRTFHERLAAGAIRTVEVVDDALDPARIKKRVRFLDRFRSGGRIAALWRALMRDERVFTPNARPRVAALLADELDRAGKAEPDDR